MRHITLPVSNYNDRSTLLKQIRADLGPVGENWTFSTNSQTLTLTYRESVTNSATITWLLLKYNCQTFK
jgi:hypothetical protein